ncbi:MAG: carboxypeptidase regulatory-like domain-containing protein [Pirellulales bacterium]|nr:carboxypeptidase regulatory-like domain-containing protein [Pirellulales bacterium]
MRSSAFAAKGVAILACLGLLSPEGAWAAPAAAVSPPAVETADAELGPRGTFGGAVVDPQGLAVPGARVMLVVGPGRVVNAKTNRDGQFAFIGVQPGTHVVAAAGTVKTCRLWAPGTAPPAARTGGVLIVANGAAVRGQREWYTWIADHYILFGCGVAAAIAVPCAVVDSNRHSAPASP